MTPTSLIEWAEARLAAATEGPWVVFSHGPNISPDIECSDGVIANIARWYLGKREKDLDAPNARAIALSRNTMPALLDVLAYVGQRTKGGYCRCCQWAVGHRATCPVPAALAALEAERARQEGP